MDTICNLYKKKKGRGPDQDRKQIITKIYL